MDKIRRPKQPAKHCSSRILFTLDDRSIQCENGQNSDLQIRGRGSGHPDPVIRGIPVPVPVFGPQFGLKIRAWSLPWIRHRNYRRALVVKCRLCYLYPGNRCIHQHIVLFGTLLVAANCAH